MSTPGEDFYLMGKKIEDTFKVIPIVYGAIVPYEIAASKGNTDAMKRLKALLLKQQRQQPKQTWDTMPDVVQQLRLAHQSEEFDFSFLLDLIFQTENSKTESKDPMRFYKMYHSAMALIEETYIDQLINIDSRRFFHFFYKDTNLSAAQLKAGKQVLVLRFSPEDFKLKIINLLQEDIFHIQSRLTGIKIEPHEFSSFEKITRSIDALNNKIAQMEKQSAPSYEILMDFYNNMQSELKKASSSIDGLFRKKWKDYKKEVFDILKWNEAAKELMDVSDYNSCKEQCEKELARIEDVLTSNVRLDPDKNEIILSARDSAFKKILAMLAKRYIKELERLSSEHIFIIDKLNLSMNEKTKMKDLLSLQVRVLREKIRFIKKREYAEVITHDFINQIELDVDKIRELGLVAEFMKEQKEKIGSLKQKYDEDNTSLQGLHAELKTHSTMPMFYQKKNKFISRCDRLLKQMDNTYREYILGGLENIDHKLQSISQESDELQKALEQLMMDGETRRTQGTKASLSSFMMVPPIVSTSAGQNVARFWADSLSSMGLPAKIEPTNAAVPS